jgi:hypothetical protein
LFAGITLDVFLRLQRYEKSAQSFCAGEIIECENAAFGVIVSAARQCLSELNIALALVKQLRECVNA